MNVLDRMKCEPTIKAMAVELAGTFYEGNRSPRFRQAFPTVKDYLEGRWHKQSGVVMRYIPGWQHHVVLARKVLTAMLSQPDSRVSPAMKERIYDAILEDRGRAARFGRKVTQRIERGGDDDQQAVQVSREAIGWSRPG